jgi:hypothetical protein
MLYVVYCSYSSVPQSPFLLARREEGEREGKEGEERYGKVDRYNNIIVDAFCIHIMYIQKASTHQPLLTCKLLIPHTVPYILKLTSPSTYQKP